MTASGRSKSTRLLLAVLVMGLAVGAAASRSSWWPHSAGLVDVQPQMLVVRAPAKGEFALHGGMSVSLFDDGLRVLHDGAVLFASVPLGSVVSAGTGRLEPDGTGHRESLTSTLDNLEVSSVERTPGGVRYTGRVFSRRATRPLSLTVTQPGAEQVDLTVRVPGVQLLVLHTAREHLTLGLPPRLPARNLRERVWWAAPAAAQGADDAYRTIRGATIGVLSREPTAVDVSHEGRTDIHVWSSSLTVTVTWSPQAGPQNGEGGSVVPRA